MLGYGFRKQIASFCMPGNIIFRSAKVGEMSGIVKLPECGNDVNVQLDVNQEPPGYRDRTSRGTGGRGQGVRFQGVRFQGAGFRVWFEWSFYIEAEQKDSRAIS